MLPKEGKMARSKPYIGIILLIVIVFLVGCSNQRPQDSPTPVPTPPVPAPPTTSHGGPVKDYISLVDNLRGAGANVDPVGEVTQSFFSVNGFVIKINGADVQVFEYVDATTAETEAQLVSSDGSSVGTSMIGWVAPPHFYKKERLIVIYVGDDVDVINILVDVVGTQFAGR